MPMRGRRPVSRRQSRRIKKRALRRRAKKANPSRNVISSVLGRGFPNRVVSTLKYVELLNINSAGVLTTANFSCNSLYDPQAALGGGQPMYFDQLMSLYRHYTVIGSKIKFKIVPTNPTNPSCRFAMFISDDATAITQPERVIEQKTGKVLLIGPNTDIIKTMTSKWSAKKTFGGSVLGNDNLQGNLTNSPVEQSYYQIALQSIDGGSAFNFQINVEIEYIAVFDELHPPPRS